MNLRDRAMFELAYACGLRAEELVSLGLDDVDHDGEQLRVEGKGRKTRFVPAGEVALKAVGEYVERGRPQLADVAGQHGERALFLSKTGSRLSTSDVRRRLRAGRATAAWSPRPVRSARTRCATALRRTCWTAARTCARSRSCLGTRACRAPRYTLG